MILRPEVRAVWEGELRAFALEALSMEPPPETVSGWSDTELVSAVEWMRAAYLQSQCVPGTDLRLYRAGPAPSHLQPFTLPGDSQ